MTMESARRTWRRFPEKFWRLTGAAFLQYLHDGIEKTAVDFSEEVRAQVAG